VKQGKKTWNQFDKGLFVVGARDAVPDGSLRRAGGVNPIRTGSARSRWGSIVSFTSLPATSCIAFGPNGSTDQHYFGDAAGNLYYGNHIIDTGYSRNTQFSFVKAPPQLQDQDYLLLSNRGKLTKVDSSGNVTNWGIAPPAHQLTAALATTTNVNQIDAFDGDSANWTATFGTTVLSDDSSFKVEGTGSMKAVTLAGQLVVIKKAVTINLNNFSYSSWASSNAYALGAQISDGTNVQVAVVAGTSGGSTPTWSTTQGAYTLDGTVSWVNYGPTGSTTSDFIEMWIGVDNPQNLDFVTLRFDLGGQQGPDAYHYRFDMASLSFVSGDLPPGTPTTAAQNLGINNILQGTALNSAELDFIQTGTVPGQGNILDPQVQRQVSALMHTLTISRHPNDWTRIRIPKSSFLRKGTTASLGWQSVVGLEMSIQATAAGNVTVWFDDLTMIGGYGLEGNYQVSVVFANTATGSVSNPPTGANATVKGATRQALKYTNIPVSTDPQVNARIVYRTVGGGATPFYVTVIPNNTDTTFVDGYADFAGINGGNSTLILGNTSIYPIQIQYDNTVPFATFGIAAGPYQGSIFWTYPPQPERVYYSPIGRPESVENFVTASYNDDGILSLFVYNGSLYALGAKRLYQIQQVSASPLLYTIVPIQGVPGIIAPFAGPAVGKNGVAWQAPEGMVYFNGFSTVEMDYPVQVLFRGESAEDYSAMTVQYAIYTKGEFWFSDGLTDTLALREDNGAWRSLGIPLTSLCYDEGEQRAHGTYLNNVLFLEVPETLTDNGLPIPWEVQVGGLLIGEDINGTVARLVVDINTNGQSVTPTIIVNDADLLPTWTANTVYPVGFRLRDSNNNIQRASVGGTSDGGIPTWGTFYNASVIDASVTWVCEGPGVFSLPAIVTHGRRRVEFNPKFAAKEVSVRLTASLTNIVELFDITIVPETGT